MTATVEDTFKDWVTVDEVAKRTSLTHKAVCLWIEKGKVKFFQPGKRHYLVYWPSVVEFRESMVKKKPAPISQSTA